MRKRLTTIKADDIVDNLIHDRNIIAFAKECVESGAYFGRFSRYNRSCFEDALSSALRQAIDEQRISIGGSHDQR